MSFGLSEKFLFFKYRCDAKVVAADVVVKCFAHYMTAPSWTPFESKNCFQGGKKLRFEIGPLQANMVVFISTRGPFSACDTSFRLSPSSLVIGRLACMSGNPGPH